MEDLADLRPRLPPVIAVVGLAGTGKSEVTRILSDRYGYQIVYFGGVVVDLVRELGMAVTPDNERRVRERLRDEEGMAAIAARSLPSVQHLMAAGAHVAIDGVYSGAELDTLHRGLRSPVPTLAVHAPRRLRTLRLAKRPVRPLTSAEVDARDHFEVVNLDKASPIALADTHILNDSGLEELASRLDAALVFVASDADVPQ
jgi:dephospho-CoA kinase